MSDKNISIQVPEMSIQEYAEKIGVTQRMVEHWIDRGYLPSIKIGKRRMVNIIARTMQCVDDFEGE